MATVMDTGIDLNLNCSPCSSEVSLKEEIRQAIIQHEIVFREQVRELHRLYWTQKHMMHEVSWRESNLTNSHQRSLQVRELQCNFSSHFDMKNYFNSHQFDIGESSGKGKTVRNVVIDLEKPINLDSDEEEDIICLSDSQAPTNKGKYEAGRFWADTSDASLHDDLNSRASEQFDMNSRASVQFDIESSPQDNPDKEEMSSDKPFQIDLNIAQDEELQNDVEHSYLLQPRNFHQKQSDSVNGSSKGSSVTHLVNFTDVSAIENPKEFASLDKGTQEKDLEVVKEETAINLNPPLGSTKLHATSSSEHKKELTGSEDDTVSSHVTSDVEMITQHSVLEMDSNIAAAAETLLCFHSEKSKSFWIREPIDFSEECSSEEDSFVIATLSLQEEIVDDAAWLPPNKLNIESNVGVNAKNTRPINLRRGRGLRDFQRDVLPGMISLSRQEICEDLQLIGYDVRKNRSRRNFVQDEWTLPVRGGTRKGRRRGGRR